jgi:DNA-binding CsgD family transcriptional regulator
LSTSAVAPQRLGADLVRLVHRGAGLREFALGAARILEREVPFDGVCVTTMDPTTLLPTGAVSENGLPTTAYPRAKEIEFRGQDFIPIRSLALGERHAATLSEATGGDLNRSQLHREIMGPSGFGDELRAVLADGRATWGALVLVRGTDSEPFSAADTAVVEGVTGLLAEGLRRAVLLDPDSERAPADEDAAGVVVVPPDDASTGDAAGMVVVAQDDSTVSADDVATAWLDELGANGSLPPVVTAVATEARTVLAEPANGRIARARVRAESGRWLVVRASALGHEPNAQVAVMIEPARPHELAPLVADAHDLTEREREVTQLVARGLPTDAIAARLHLSTWTVQDHLKAIFEKVGVATRGELVARVFFRQWTPAL